MPEPNPSSFIKFTSEKTEKTEFLSTSRSTQWPLTGAQDKQT